MYLAIPEYAYTGIFSHPLGQLYIQEQQVRLMVFDPEEEKIIRWIPVP
jgi:hypothetical protein